MKALAWQAQARPHTQTSLNRTYGVGEGAPRTGSLGGGASATPLWRRRAHPPRTGRSRPVQRTRSCSALLRQRAEGCRWHLCAAAALRRGALDARPAVERTQRPAGSETRSVVMIFAFSE